MPHYVSDGTELCVVDGCYRTCAALCVSDAVAMCVGIWWHAEDLFESACGAGRRDYMEDYASVVPSMMIGTVLVSMVAVYDVRLKQYSFT